MKLKNKEIIAAIDNFENLNKAGIKLPGRIGFTIKQNIKRSSLRSMGIILKN